MKFTPKSEKELMEEKLLPEKVECDYEIIKSVWGAAKSSGNNQFALTLKSWAPSGQQGLVNLYIPEDNLWMLRRLCYSARRSDLYERGEIADHELLGLCGKYKNGIKKDKNGQYPDQNCVLDFIIPKDGEKPVINSNADPEFNDEVPF